MPYNPWNNSPYGTPKTKFYRKIDRNVKSKGNIKILDENIDDFISNLSPDTSDMSDDSDFEFDPAVMDNLVDQCTPDIMLDLDNLEKVYDLVVEQLPPVGRLTAVQLKRFAMWCMMLGRANLKLCRSVYKQSAIVLATTVHLLYLLSTSYKYVLLTIYGLIVKLDHWTDRVLDDRTVSKESQLMDTAVRNKIAESISLSKKPLNSKRARELMINASGSKTQNAPGPGGFFQWLHGTGDTVSTCLDTVASCIFGGSKAPSKVALKADEGPVVSQAASDLAKEISQPDMKSPDITLADSSKKIPDMNDLNIMNLPDLSDKMPDMNDLKNFAGQLQDIDLEEKMKGGKKTIKKLGNGLNSIGNKMFGKSSKKEPEKKKSKKIKKSDINVPNVNTSKRKL